MRNCHRLGMVLGLGTLAYVLWTDAAAASGISSARFGGELGNPVTTNPTALYYNPAGIAESKGYHLFLDLSLALRSASYTHRRGDTQDGADEPAGAEGANYGRGTLFNVVPLPMFGATAKFGNFAAGVAAYIPFGGSSIWDKNKSFEGNTTYPGALDGPNRWYSINGTIDSTYLTGGVAYKIPSLRLSVGLSGNLIYSVVNTLRARNADGSANVATEGRSYTDAHGWQGSFGLGLMYEAQRDKLWFGVSYQARPNVSGGMTLRGELRNHIGGSESVTKIRIEEDMPDIVRLGVRFKPTPKLELRLFGDWTRWSALKNQCLGQENEPCNVLSNGAPANTGPIQNLPRHWNDAFGIRAGASFFAIPRTEVMVGAGFDSNAIPDKALDPALLDFNKFSFTLGGRFELIPRTLYGALTYTQLLYATRDTTGKSDNYRAWQLPSKGPDAGGVYKQIMGVVNTNLELVF